MTSLQLLSDISPKSSLLCFLNKNLTPNFIDNKILSQSIKSKNAKAEIPTGHIEHITRIINNCFDNLKKELKEHEEDEELTEIEKMPIEIFLIYLDNYREQIFTFLNQKLSVKFLLQKIIKDIYVENLELLSVKNKRASFLAKKQAQLENFVKRKESKIEDIIEQEQKYKKSVDFAVTNNIYDANLKMIKKLNVKKQNEQELMATLKAKEIEYKKLLDQNTAKQKTLTELSLKAQQTLQAVLLKYDTDVGSRVEEIERIQGELDEDKRKLEEWKSTIFAQQEAKFNRLMQQKEEEESAIREQRLEEIKQNHAAKVIQKEWKKYKRVTSKKGGKAGSKDSKKKKK